MVAEHLETGKRTTLGGNSRVTSLGDISIYTTESELSLKEVLSKMAALGVDAPTSKSSTAEIKAFFDKAVPDYDGDRFYVSHMKKVLDWYHCLKSFASLDFEDESGQQAEENA